MFVALVSFTIAADRIESFRNRVIEQARDSVRLEAGCLQFDVCTPETAEASVLLYEVYTDRSSFDAHLASAHFQAFDAEVASWVTNKAVTFWQRVSA